MARGRLTRKIGIVALGRAAGTFSVFAVNAMLVRTWPKEDVGIFLAIWVMGNTLAPLFLLGLPTSLLYFFPRRSQAGREGLVLQSLVCLAVSGALLAGLLLYLGPRVAGWLEPEALADLGDLKSYLLPFLPYIFSLVAGGFIDSALVAAERPQWQAFLGVAGGAGLIGAAWAGAVLGLEIRDVLLLFSTVGVLRLGMGILLVGYGVGIGGGAEKWKGLGEYFHYSLPVWLNDAVGGLSRYVDRFVVLFFFSEATFAHYHLGAVEVPISLLLTAVVAVLVPEVSRLYQMERLEEIGVLWNQAVGRLALVVLPFFFFLFFFAETIIELYLTGQYRDVRWVFRIFLLVMPLRCAVYNPLLVGMGKARWALWGSLGDLAANLGLSVVLVLALKELQPESAYLGPAAATVAATYVQVFFLIGVIGRHLCLGVKELLPWGRLLRVGSVSCGAALVGWWAVGWIDSPALKLVVGGGLFGGLLAGLLWLSPRDRAELRLVFQGLGRGVGHAR